ncbi:MAG: hypothetical protein H0V62_12590 [Gammaproteobacteria bacterium]|nr:hypothetical protein [Gammaproteobacteria bacterium]
MIAKRKRPACEVGRKDTKGVWLRHPDRTTGRLPTPRLSSARAATKTAIVHAALIGAIDTARASAAIRLLRLVAS